MTIDDVKTPDLDDDRAVAPRRISKVSEVVAREIVHDIRGLSVNTRLPSEAEMLARYRVGRGSLREALRILEVQGLIVIRPGTGGGPVVGKVRARHYADTTSLYFHTLGSTYRDVMEARLVMEPVLARLAARRQDRSAMDRLLRAAESPPTDAVPDYLDTERDFHTLVSGMSGNPVLDLITRALKIVYTDRVYNVVSPEMHGKLAHDHAEIAHAIDDGDEDLAEQLMRAHMEEFVRDSVKQNPGVLDERVDWH